jgi:hypothetical protein
MKDFADSDKFCTVSVANIMGHFFTYLSGIPNKDLVNILDLAQIEIATQEPHFRRR